MPMSSVSDKVNSEAILRALQHAECLSEDQITHDIKDLHTISNELTI